jgi:23S rRNA pseudouridine955/2504/2580 synthase
MSETARATGAVRTLCVGAEEADQRLDRWFKRRFPALSHGRLEKLLRTGQVRVDGKRAKASLRLAAGQAVRVPPGVDAAVPGEAVGLKAKRRKVSEADSRFVRSLVLHRDDDVIVLNKPPGLAVQGGSFTPRHLDAMLDALTFDAAERPRLVHRLDRDTSGVLLLARNVRAAARLAEAFRAKTARKLYWALVAGVPRPSRGKIDMALAKHAGPHGERVGEDKEAGKRAITLYAIVEAAGDRAAWLVMRPLTGRTHQLRAHCADALKTPIVGDAKYGGEAAALGGGDVPQGLHLHARSIEIAHPSGSTLVVKAPLPPHMQATWALFEFDANADPDPFPME